MPKTASFFSQPWSQHNVQYNKSVNFLRVEAKSERRLANKATIAIPFMPFVPHDSRHWLFTREVIAQLWFYIACILLYAILRQSRLADIMRMLVYCV